MSCSSSCTAPGTHASYGACLRSKRLEIANPEAYKFNAGMNGQLNNYVKAREAGLQPDNIFKKDVDKAWAETDRTGEAYRGDA